MAKKITPEPQPARLSQQQISAGLPLIKRRLAELKAINVDNLEEQNGDNILAAMTQKINATLRVATICVLPRMRRLQRQ